MFEAIGSALVIAGMASIIIIGTHCYKSDVTTNNSPCAYGAFSNPFQQ